MRRGVSLIGLPWFAYAVFAMTGCSEPPSKEHDQAVAAIAAADRAGAAQFAATDLGDARAALAKYDGYVADRDYKLALATAIDARDRAYDAAKNAQAEQARLKTDVETRTQQLTALIATADARLATAGRQAPRLVQRVRQSRQEAQLTLQESSTLTAGGRWQDASKRLAAATDALKGDVAMLDATVKRTKH